MYLLQTGACTGYKSEVIGSYFLNHAAHNNDFTVALAGGGAGETLVEVRLGFEGGGHGRAIRSGWWRL